MGSFPENPLSTARRLLTRLHRRLLPDDPRVGWLPYLWLVYLSFFFWRYLYIRPDTVEVVLGIASLALFLGVYFNAWWKQGWPLVPHVIVITTLGVAWAPVNPGANVLFIFAAAFAAFLGPVNRAVTGIALVALSAGVTAWFWQQNPVFWVPALFFSVLVGVVNIYYSGQARRDAALRMSQAEVQELARVAERERISRDLHDLLGHTLSLVALKAELAGRLVGKDPARAQAEIHDVEQVSRAALAQVREAVTGIRERGLRGELEHARLALKAAGIALEVTGAVPTLPPASEVVLALVLREAITNVIRHSGAWHCRISFATDKGQLMLEVADDGRGAREVAGGGIDGMRARVAGVNGWLEITTNRGTCLRAWLPAAGIPA